jgi:acyl-coenzyme A synthetase/AMP-(fatty) acid ligase
MTISDGDRDPNRAGPPRSARSEFAGRDTMAPAQETSHIDDSGDRVVAWRDGRPIARSALLADAGVLARELPGDIRIANCCADQYHFLVVFVAALMRGETVLLPHAFDTAILAELADDHPGLVFVTDRPRGTEALREMTVAFDGTADGPAPDFPDIASDRPVAAVFSSGSTGKPVPTNRRWGWMQTGVKHYTEAFGLADLPAYNLVTTAPSQHAYGLETSVFLTLCHRGAVHTEIPLYPADVVAALKQIPPPRVLVTTPVHLRVLVESRIAAPELRLVLSATAPLATSLAAEAEAMLGAPVREVYGCTEIGLIATRRTVEGDVWTVPEGMRLEAVEGGMRILSAHLPGPILLEDGFEPAADGQVRFTGRRNDIVKVAGKRASLSGLDAALNSIEGVIDGVYLPPGDDDGVPANQRLMACVVTQDSDVDGIRRALRSKVASTFVPRPLIRVEHIPRNGTGKVRYAELRALAQATARAHQDG